MVGARIGGHPGGGRKILREREVPMTRLMCGSVKCAHDEAKSENTSFMRLLKGLCFKFNSVQKELF